MDFGAIPIFNVMKAKMDYISANQNALTQNIASADIPGYQAVDVAAPDFKQMAFGSPYSLQPKLSATLTNARHITPKSAMESSFSTVKRASTYERNPNGNNVSIEEEMAKMSQKFREMGSQIYHKS